MSWHKSFGALVLLLASSMAAFGAAPRVLHTAGYESPVQGGPTDLLIISGVGFAPGDRVVYQAADDPLAPHPKEVPVGTGAAVGLAEIVQVAQPPYSLTVRLPAAIDPGRIYHLWVVNAAGEWSAAMSINDPRPMWFSPAYVYETADLAHLGRYIRIVGRNLAPSATDTTQIRLTGPQQYLVRGSTPQQPGAIASYVAEAALPARVTPGTYSVSFSRDGRHWIEVEGQRLEVRPDVASLPRYSLDDPRFGGCHAGDGVDDSNCLERALASAAQQGGVIVIPTGRWDLSATARLVVPKNVQLVGADRSSTIVSHDAGQTRDGEGLLTLTGNNAILGLTFTDTQRYSSHEDSRPIIRLGTQPAEAGRVPLEPVSDIVIASNVFDHVGRAIGQSDRTLHRLFVTHNEFAAYDSAIELPGNGGNLVDPFRIDDSIIRWNRFVPGSYTDMARHLGVIASGIGASHRLDFSSNTADGVSTDGLQDAGDPPGWRAAFFWNMNNNNELVLVAQNNITCSGDKVGDGEALAFDASGNRQGFNGTPPVTAATADTLTVRDSLASGQGAARVSTDYRGYWLQIMDGPGLGQVRKVSAYHTDPASGLTVFHVAPDWDVVPSIASRVVLSREFWQLYIVANEIDQRSPPCRKANLTGPAGGSIGIWAPSADSVIEANRQHDTSGILFSMAYSIEASSCPTCYRNASLQTALEIRGNLVDGEYDWSSDCSRSGISGAFGASPTPESPPPGEAAGISIAHNEIRHADGFRGGALDFAATWHVGPPPNNWPLMRSLAIFGNVISDIGGSPPSATCKFGQRGRVAMRFDGTDNIRNAVLSGNRCERVDTVIDVGGNHPLRLCAAADPLSCECREH